MALEMEPNMAGRVGSLIRGRGEAGKKQEFNFPLQFTITYRFHWPGLSLRTNGRFLGSGLLRMR